MEHILRTIAMYLKTSIYTNLSSCCIEDNGFTGPSFSGMSTRGVPRQGDPLSPL